MVVMVVGLAVEIGDGAYGKKCSPAQVKRLKIFHRFAYQQHQQVGHQAHDQAGGGYELVRVHFARIVYFGKFHMLLFELLPKANDFRAAEVPTLRF